MRGMNRHGWGLSGVVLVLAGCGGAPPEARPVPTVTVTDEDRVAELEARLEVCRNVIDLGDDALTVTGGLADTASAMNMALINDDVDGYMSAAVDLGDVANRVTAAADNYRAVQDNC